DAHQPREVSHRRGAAGHHRRSSLARLHPGDGGSADQRAESRRPGSGSSTLMPSVVTGDARDPSALTRALGGRRPALLLTAPPYRLLTRRRKGGDERERRAGKKIDRDPIHRFEDVRAYRRFTAEWLPAAARSVAEGGTLVIWTNFLGKQPIVSVAGEAGFPVLVGEFVWAKLTTEGGGNERPARVYLVGMVLRQEPLVPLAPAGAARPWAGVAGFHPARQSAPPGRPPQPQPHAPLPP